MAPDLAEVAAPRAEHDVHSRSRRAGYNPARLFDARALVVGAGAIGQNVLQDLALAGVGHTLVVDFDAFEPHNATRSPLYPTLEEQRRWGLGKAKVVAHKARRLMTAPAPTVRYASVPIQSLGDAPFAWADLVFSDVDQPGARAYLADRSRLHGKPLVEVGFDGAEINLALFGPDADEVCWRCTNESPAGAFSCTRYALEAEAAGIIPAIQNAAAVLAGLQSECGIMWLHNEAPLRGRVVYGNVRAMTLRSVALTRDAECVLVHRNANLAGDLHLDSGATLHALLDAVQWVVGPAEVRLPDTFVVRVPCPGCGAPTDACCPEWRWLMSPRCAVCGGPFPRSAPDRAPSGVKFLMTDQRDELIEIGELSCAAAGLPAGTTVEVWPKAGDGPVLLRLQGGLDQLVEEVTTAAQGESA